jgi:hypothetical protein
MALWGISTASETAASKYAIPKFQLETDRNTSPWNTFADVRGWIQRRYKTKENSGLSTRYFDEVLVPVVGLNSTNLGGTTGIGTAGPVAVFFEDPNQASPISVGGGGTTNIATSGMSGPTTGYVHVVFNELVFAGAGSTVLIRTFDANDANESTPIVGTVAPNTRTQYAWAGSADAHGSPNVYPSFNGQITNRVAFSFTTPIPSNLLSANVTFLSTKTTIGQTVAIGATTIFVNSVTNVVAGVSSISVVGVAITNAPVVAVGNTFIQIGSASTINSTISGNSNTTFSTFTRATKLRIDVASGFVGVITDGSSAVGVISSFTSQFGDVILRNVGGAGTTGSVGLGTTTLTVR